MLRALLFHNEVWLLLLLATLVAGLWRGLVVVGGVVPARLTLLTADLFFE